MKTKSEMVAQLGSYLLKLLFSETRLQGKCMIRSLLHRKTASGVKHLDTHRTLAVTNTTAT